MSSASLKVQQNRRREARQKQAVYQLLTSLTQTPFGQDAQHQYKNLADWAAPGDEPVLGTLKHSLSPPCSNTSSSLPHSTFTSVPVVDWSTMPVSCDPVALLDNAQNTTRRKGVPVDQQVTMLQFSSPSGSAASGSGATTAQASSDSASRGQQKRWQVESFAIVLRKLLAPGRPGTDAQTADSTGQRSALHVVDFGCGTGGLLLPLAHMFPQCVFVGVEMKRPALAILEQRAALAGLSNVQTYHGMIEQYQGPLDVALALHACGNATDHVMLLAQQRRAGFLVCPCCVGKLKFSIMGGSSFSANIRTWHAVTSTASDNIATSTAQPSTDSGPQAGAFSEPVSHSAHDGAQQAAGSDAEQAGTSGSGQAPEQGQTPQEQRQGGSSLDRWPPLAPLTHPRSQLLQSLLPDADRTFALMASIADCNFTHSQAPVGGQTQDPASAAANHSATPATSATQADDNAGSVTPPAIKQGGSGDAEGGASMVVDSGGTGDSGTGSAAGVLPAVSLDEISRCCKLHVELDRLQAAREAGYVCGLYRVVNAGATAKGDMLVGLPQERELWAHAHALFQS